MRHAVLMVQRLREKKKRSKEIWSGLQKQKWVPSFLISLPSFFCDRVILHIAHISTIQMKFPQPEALTILAKEGVGLLCIACRDACSACASGDVVFTIL